MKKFEIHWDAIQLDILIKASICLAALAFLLNFICRRWQIEWLWYVSAAMIIASLPGIAVLVIALIVAFVTHKE